MRKYSHISVIIPAYNEEKNIGHVLSALPLWVDDVIVVDNGSTDETARVAKARGARVITEPHRGYGSACLAGIAALQNTDIVVFLDGDFSDDPHEMVLLMDPIAKGEADFVLGSRVRGQREKGALTLQARFGNWLACFLMRLFWMTHYTDIGPFRAIRTSALKSLHMKDKNFGWTVEMQIKAKLLKLRILEVPVNYRKRLSGSSKISGTFSGIVKAGTKILWTIFKMALRGHFEKEEREGKAQRLIVFTRYPEAGKAKTRLIPALGEQGAADLSRRMTEHAVRMAREVPTSLELRFDGAGVEKMKAWLGNEWSYVSQGNGDLGERMKRAFQETFRQGVNKAVVIGTDCPGLTAKLVQTAFAALDSNDMVLGPAADGGYYLIGLKKNVPELFDGIPWGTENVFLETLARAKEAGCSVAFLETLNDVDRPDDIDVWERAQKPWLSIIIPALNEEENLAHTLKSIKNVSRVEVIVVDGGSSDRTVNVAKKFGAKVVLSSPGRARQMNAGAKAAEGDVFLFLHADTLLPKDFDAHIHQAFSQKNVVAGAFQITINAPYLIFWLFEHYLNWKSRRTRMAFGDQAIFVRASVFNAMSGFPELPILEDYAFVRSIRRHGRFVIVPARVVTSARRFLSNGLFQTALKNRAVLLAYHLGISPVHIVRWYYGQTQHEKPSLKRRNQIA